MEENGSCKKCEGRNSRYWTSAEVVKKAQNIIFGRSVSISSCIAVGDLAFIIVLSPSKTYLKNAKIGDLKKDMLGVGGLSCFHCINI